MSSIAPGLVPRKDDVLTTIAERLSVYPKSHVIKGLCGPA
jgi:hypothetical protein